MIVDMSSLAICCICVGYFLIFYSVKTQDFFRFLFYNPIIEVSSLKARKRVNRMVELSFLSKVMHHFSFSGFERTAEIVSKRSDHRKLTVMADMLYCGLAYGCGYSDYRLLRFETLSRANRKTFVTRGYNNRLVKLLNAPENHVLFDNKVLFLQRFDRFAGRDWLDLQNADLGMFIRFLGDKETIIVKPLEGTCGKGVKKLLRADFSSSEEMFRQIKRDGYGKQDTNVQNDDH